MNSSKISLVRASQVLKIPFTTAKQMLFCSSPKLSSSMPLKKSHTIYKKEKHSLKEKVQLKKRQSQNLERIQSPRLSSTLPQWQLSAHKAHYPEFCEECNCFCCPSVRQEYYSQVLYEFNHGSHFHPVHYSSMNYHQIAPPCYQPSYYYPTYSYHLPEPRYRQRYHLSTPLRPPRELYAKSSYSSPSRTSRDQDLSVRSEPSTPFFGRNKN